MCSPEGDRWRSLQQGSCNGQPQWCRTAALAFPACRSEFLRLTAYQTLHSSGSRLTLVPSQACGSALLCCHDPPRLSCIRQRHRPSGDCPRGEQQLVAAWKALRAAPRTCGMSCHDSDSWQTFKPLSRHTARCAHLSNKVLPRTPSETYRGCSRMSQVGGQACRCEQSCSMVNSKSSHPCGQNDKPGFHLLHMAAGCGLPVHGCHSHDFALASRLFIFCVAAPLCSCTGLSACPSAPKASTKLFTRCDGKLSRSML